MSFLVTMSPQQKQRAFDLYRIARNALDCLAEERLSLAGPTREALDKARGALEEFDCLRILQPVDGGPGRPCAVALCEMEATEVVDLHGVRTDVCARHAKGFAAHGFATVAGKAGAA